ncbi:hypothetical protein M406DRAFT_337680 [Cryphonectria parasitica EP155]|uniref:DAGKc domain-containing protein n=1 Tax=Cryphonectria parasitica (strain ATCC 38755 / EP155) TaxID=660469 RepID=A0A9P4Y562_CRYP1|nr:uncharacterized protein M406DRAFT_337680 [Cryphonectria parasitica EP155]KAF3766733.1 hypothetical protein M406DRAFT_337680 [Cryphonectria parasitica EP155]
MHTSCLRSSAPRSIPLYNVLWAELSADQHTLTVDYAENVTDVQLQAAKLSFSTTLTAAATTSAPGEGEDSSAPADSEAITRWVDTLMSRAYGPAPRCKTAYVLVNPHAGPGGAQKKWDHQVKPIFEAARMPMTIHTTTRSGEALDLVRQMDIDKFDIVVPCSGDGLAYEVYNGLGSRPDASRALHKIAVAHVPCGSGNALACNVFGTHRPSLAALAIVKGVPTPIDLISITQGGTRTLSFLSQTLGVMAEADLATEHLRWMGSARFMYGALTRILKKKEYPCELYVKMEVEHKEGVRDHYKRHREGSVVGPDLAAAPSLDREGQAGEKGLPPLRYGTTDDKIPEDWVKVDADKIGTIFTGNLAWMAPDVLFFNAALMNDGFLDVYIINADVPFSKVLGLFASSSDNTFIDHPLVKYFKVSAFRIVPKYEHGYISIDGEKVPFEPFQAEVHPGLGMVITKRGTVEAPGPKNWDKVTPAQRLMA